jgi:hypothetical protein
MRRSLKDAEKGELNERTHKELRVKNAQDLTINHRQQRLAIVNSGTLLPFPSHFRGAFDDVFEELAAFADAVFGEVGELGVDLVLAVEWEAGPGEGHGVGALAEEIIPGEAF